MLYQELHQRYGERIAKRIEMYLAPAELEKADMLDLVEFLEDRAEIARLKYQQYLTDPAHKNNIEARAQADALHKRWRDAEEISYLVTLADEINNNPAIRLAVG